MRILAFVVTALAILGWTAPASAVIGTTTVKVSDGAAPVPQATVTITFKSQAGTPIRTVRRTTRRSVTPRISIPDNTRTVDISVTTATGRTEQRVGVDVSTLTNREFVIDVPGGAPSSSPSSPRLAVPGEAPPASGPEGPIVGIGLGGQTTSCSNWRTTRNEFDGIEVPVGDERDACFSSAFRASFFLGTSWRISANWLAGIEADIGVTNSSKSVAGIPGSIGSIPGVTAAVAANDSVTVKKLWDASLRGRFGYFVTPTAVVYATGGIALQDLEATLNCSAAGACGTNGLTPFSATNSRTLIGWTLGGGVEVSLTERIVARGEYRYADYGTFSATYGTPTTVIAVGSDIKLRTHTALIGLALKLGAGL